MVKPNFITKLFTKVSSNPDPKPADGADNQDNANADPQDENTDESNEDDTSADESNDKPNEADAPADEPKDESKENDVPADEPKDEPKKDDVPTDEPKDEPKENDVPADEPKDATDTDPVDVPAEPAKSVDLDNPDRRLVTSVADENSYVVGFSIQGRSHISNGTPCEDYHAYKELAPGWRLFITSDGAGSARESARGSKANCEMAEKFITQLLTAKGWIEKNYMPTELEWHIECYNIFLSMKNIIFRQADKQAAQYKESKEAELAALEAEIEKCEDLVQRGHLESKKHDLIANINRPLSARDFNATIILMLLTPNGMLTAHIGDGRMGYKSKDGEWKALLTPHKGDEASATVFIPNDWHQIRVPAFTMSDVYLPECKVVHELPEAIVLMSDGCENITWSCYTRDENGYYYDPNKPFKGFFEPLLEEMNRDLTPEQRADRLIEIINVGTSAGKAEHDDRTMIFAAFK
ncbi:MAG: protein phosphatase 2C domain-containing protein [Alistipes sp.]|nr:protein phosphatase 2C domain-containing protein [Alistipes sp.]